MKKKTNQKNTQQKNVYYIQGLRADSVPTITSAGDVLLMKMGYHNKNNTVHSL